MVTTRELMGSGMPASQAAKLGSDDASLTVSAAGTTQATATLLTSDFSVVTTVASGAGVRMPSAHGQGLWVIINAGANVLSAYPATSEKFNNLAANTSVQIAPGKCAMLWGDNNIWGVNISA